MNTKQGDFEVASEPDRRGHAKIEMNRYCWYDPLIFAEVGKLSTTS